MKEACRGIRLLFLAPVCWVLLPLASVSWCMCVGTSSGALSQLVMWVPHHSVIPQLGPGPVIYKTWASCCDNGALQTSKWQWCPSSLYVPTQEPWLTCTRGCFLQLSQHRYHIFHTVYHLVSEWAPDTQTPSVLLTISLSLPLPQRVISWYLVSVDKLWPGRPSKLLHHPMGCSHTLSDEI